MYSSLDILPCSTSSSSAPIAGRLSKDSRLSALLVSSSIEGKLSNVSRLDTLSCSSSIEGRLSKKKNLMPY